MIKITNTVNHSTFGGVIVPSDFCTDYEGSRNIANRIASDWAFDKQCRRNIENRERGKIGKEINHEKI